MYDPETKQESSMWKTPGSPSPKKFKVSRPATYKMFIVFFKVKELILTHNYREEGCKSSLLLKGIFISIFDMRS